jgi:hypothetical protein
MTRRLAHLATTVLAALFWVGVLAVAIPPTPVQAGTNYVPLVWRDSQTVGAGGHSSAAHSMSLATVFGDLEMYKMANTGESHMHFGLQFDHTVYPGGTMIPHLHYMHDLSGADCNVVLELDWAWAGIEQRFGDGGAGAVPSHSQVTVTLTKTDAYVHKYKDLTTIPGDSHGLSSVLLGSVGRDADDGSDNCSTPTVWFLGFDIHTQYQSNGSRCPRSTGGGACDGGW